MIGFDDMIAGMLSNKKLKPTITEFFIRGRDISLGFITQYYFAVPKNITLNSAHYFIMKIQNKEELQQIAGLDWNKLAQVWNIVISCQGVQ